MSDGDLGTSLHGAVLPGDAPLVAALRGTAAGDRRAFERVYRLTSGKLMAVCRRLLPESQEAEEALQDAFLSVWRHAGRYDALRGRPMTWLIVIAHRCAIDRLRARRPLPTAPLPIAEQGMTAGDGVHDGLLGCLGLLEGGERSLLRSAFYEGATYAEIARRSATPLGTVKSRVRRALLKLAECMR